MSDENKRIVRATHLDDRGRHDAHRRRKSRRILGLSGPDDSHATDRCVTSQLRIPSLTPSHTISPVFPITSSAG